MPTLIIGGTTSAGKSSLAMEIAERYEAAIVSADAMTVYRGLDIGTAKPSPEELERVPHGCIDVRDIDEDFSVSDFVEAVEEMELRHQRLIVVGGTPFYLSALVNPLADLPEADPGVREDLEALTDPHAALAAVDPEAANRLHPNDRVRIIRALEVHAITGQTLTALHARGARNPPMDAARVWLDPSDLDERIDSRLEQMVEQGYVAEVRGILEQGWSPGEKPLRAFAYRHLIAHIVDGSSLDEALRCTARDTRRFARKQRTWARGLGWGADDPDVVRALAERTFSAPIR